MTIWPPILHDNLAGRLAVQEGGFAAPAGRPGARLGGGSMDDSAFERALNYPWGRPVESFFMQDGAVELLGPGADLGSLPLGDAERYPLVAFGSNGAPGVLAAKLAVLEPDERDVLVLTGE